MKNLFLVLLLLASCSTNPAKIAKGLLTDDGGLDIDTELTVGDKREVVDTDITTGGIQKASVINNEEGVPAFFMILMALGWLLPSPGEIWRGLTSLSKRGSK